MRHNITVEGLIVFLLLWAIPANPSKAQEFDDTGWQLVYQENFDTPFTGVDGQTFGQDDWLILQLINGGEIIVENGYAQLDAPDFWNAALIRSTDILPKQYKLRTKIGHINYDLSNYEQADFDDPDFNDHFNHPENGMYFLTVTNDTCVDTECAELWWHYHRKMVIDVDNHVNWSGGGETFHPVYMVYMDPQTGPGGNLLRTWDGETWDISPDNWNVAYTYEYDTWYYAELEKRADSMVLRLYDADRNIIEETDPVDLDLVFAMDDSVEYLYVGEPHTDDYEGDVRIDEITLLIPADGTYICGDVENDGLVNVIDILYLIEYKFSDGPPPVYTQSADVNNDGIINILDILFLVDYKFGSGPEPDC